MEQSAPQSGHSDRGAVLVVRLWAEGPAREGLRARITSTLDLSSGDETVTMAADEETILATVREWLQAFTAG